ncbi:MAG: hypothetical protein IKM82_02600 [Oscillospiraceae bacterium]|nr:hypothetical protein [Oscillospiraceae bacterium]
MTEVVTIKFKSSGKTYYFAPNGLHITDGEKVIVETAKGLEIADCVQGNRFVEDDAVVQPLRPVVRVATLQDRRIDEQNRLREKDALVICQKKIEDHGLDMKLVDVECNFEGSKILFFFTSEGRVDFRELVKDLASVFHNRIELRQIGVRDEAKMLGGIGICGRPYCCSTFLNEFAPVSTKMAKVQNLSLNPSKISGSCGRLMCCLRYEEEAYEDLVRNVPRVGAFVETTGGYGTVLSVDLLRQKVKVHLEDEADDVTRVFRAVEVATVPGGHPKEGEEYPHVLEIVPEEPEEELPPEDPWAVPAFFAEEPAAEPTAEAEETAESGGEAPSSSRRRRPARRTRGGDRSRKGAPEKPNSPEPARQEKEKLPPEKKSAENKPPERETNAPGKAPSRRRRGPRRFDGAEAPKSAEAPKGGHAGGDAPAEGGSEGKRKPYHRRFYRRGKKPSGQGGSSST